MFKTLALASAINVFFPQKFYVNYDESFQHIRRGAIQVTVAREIDDKITLYAVRSLMLYNGLHGTIVARDTFNTSKEYFTDLFLEHIILNESVSEPGFDAEFIDIEDIGEFKQCPKLRIKIKRTDYDFLAWVCPVENEIIVPRIQETIDIRGQNATIVYDRADLEPSFTEETD